MVWVLGALKEALHSDDIAAGGRVGELEGLLPGRLHESNKQELHLLDLELGFVGQTATIVEDGLLESRRGPVTLVQCPFQCPNIRHLCQREGRQLRTREAPTHAQHGATSGFAGSRVYRMFRVQGFGERHRIEAALRYL